MVAPVTGNDVGIRRAEIKQGIRELILCKDQDGKIGLRLKSVDNVCIINVFMLEFKIEKLLHNFIVYLSALNLLYDFQYM